MHVVIPMAGTGRRFREAGFDMPKPLIPVGGRPMIERLLAAFPQDWPRSFVCNQEDLADPRFVAELRRLAPTARLVGIPAHREGPVRTLLEGLEAASDLLPDDEPVLINYCDFGFHWDPWAFEAWTRHTACDGAILCYTGFHPEYLRPTLYAYCRVEGDRVLEVREKGHFTPDRTREPASSGSYWFRTGAMARQALARYDATGPRINGEGYVSLVFNELIRAGRDVRTYPIPWFLQWGTPQDLADHEAWARAFNAFPSRPPDMPPSPEAPQLLMPMAGRGSRFPGETPKPLRPVLGRPMFQAAIDHLPATRGQVLVIRGEFEDDIRAAAPDATRVVLDHVTEGQAITCLRGAEALDPQRPVLVSNCDHGLTWLPERWDAMMAATPDVVVWGVRNYPGADRTPNAFAYLAAEGDRVTGMTCKIPLSDRPREDLLLLGTFWFRRPSIMVDAIRELVRRDRRVNGEFYLDCVVEPCLEAGMDVRVFQAEGWLCWGTPEAVAEFDWWHGWFTGPGRSAPR